MKWISLAQLLMLVIVCVLLANFKTITEAGMIVFEIFIALSLILSIVLFVLQVKKDKKSKKENEEK